MLPLLGELVQGQEGVGVPGRAVADPVALPEEPPLPDELSAVPRLPQVPVLLEHLSSRTVVRFLKDPWGTRVT